MEQFYQAVDHLYQTGDLAGVEETLLGKLEQLGQRNPVQYAQVANELAAYYRQVSRCQQAEAWFERALCVLEGCDMRDSELYASVEMNYAGLLRLTGQLSLAEERFSSAKDRMERLSRTDSYAYHCVLNNLTLVYQIQGQLEQAEQSARASLAWNLRQPDNANEVAASLTHLAEICQSRGEDDAAWKLIQEALKRYEQMPEPNVHHVAALETCANLCLKREQWRQALGCFVQAREKVAHFFGRDNT